MKMFVNIAAFAILMTYAMNLGSMFGILLCCAGFLIMMCFIEEIENND